MKVWRDRDGNWITLKEFLLRWRQGIEAITPLQQAKSQLRFTFISLLGLACGIIVSLYAFDSLWWLFIVLVGAFGNTIVMIIGQWQKKRLMERFEMEVEDEYQQNT